MKILIALSQAAPGLARWQPNRPWRRPCTDCLIGPALGRGRSGSGNTQSCKERKADSTNPKLLLRQAFEFLKATGTAETPFRYVLYLSMGWLHYHRNDLEKASEVLPRARSATGNT